MWSLRTSAWKPSGVVSRFVRKVRTASGAVAVQVVTRRGRQVERVEHVGSAHTDAELALLLAAARERLYPGQGVLDLGDLPVVPARMDEVADWTGEPELPLQPAAPAAGGRPAAVAAGGRVVAVGVLAGAPRPAFEASPPRFVVARTGDRLSLIFLLFVPGEASASPISLAVCSQCRGAATAYQDAVEDLCGRPTERSRPCASCKVAIIANRVVHTRAETVSQLADGRDRLGL